MTIVDVCMVYVMHVYLSYLHVSRSVETSETKANRAVFVQYKKKRGKWKKITNEIWFFSVSASRLRERVGARVRGFRVRP